MNGFEKYNFQEFCYQTINELGFSKPTSIQEKVIPLVYKNNDIIGISQMTPGPVAINSATFVGYKINGVIGSIVATLGVITTSFILVIIINRVLDKFKESKIVKSALLGMRPALIALIIYAFWDLAVDAYKDWKSIVITLIIAVVLWSKKVHPILVIVIAAILGLVLYI